ncbi:surfeit locus protein 6 homolog [Anoplophora glabripennis]|uniref:surfeit locus protein 6 homolog n=1 Tax=Anoplophora glabripennis TaxID=217634 RepID=UPI00087362B9|nr:surfeit locus protein 6 homolog [Anoplophora glabripennis]
MQLLKNKFDSKKVEQFLISENKFITDLFSITAIPERKDFLENDVEDDDMNGQNSGFSVLGTKTSRAKSLQELQQRLEAITSKKKLTYKEKLAKKGLKNRMKKKSKQDERNAKQKLIRAAKLTNTEIKIEEGDTKPNTTKPVFNSENKMVFSKFDFANLGMKRQKKQEKDPKKLLKKIDEQKDKLQKLEESGETEKIIEIKEKTAWKNAFAKAEGVKVKDDPTLLKKSLKRKEQKQRSSKNKWEKRQQGVQKAKEERQQKRSDNIEKRKKEKKNRKLKTASKRGRIIPGF